MPAGMFGREACMAKLDAIGLRPIDERITRFLCATVHLDGSFANHACGVLSAPGRQGQAPEHEIDPVAVARHAHLSLVRRKERDIYLLLVLIATVGAAVLFFGMGAGQSLRLREVAVLITALPLVGWLVAFAIVYQHYSQARQSALAVFRGMGFARNAAPPLDPLKEQRLHDLHFANVVIYNSFSPFVGTGHTLDSWRINLYTNPAPETRRARWQGPVSLSPSLVHEHLLHAVPPVLNHERERVRAERRLYVDGGTARYVPDLIPKSASPLLPRRPATSVSEELLDQYTEEPDRTARTYCCFVDNSGNGDVVVTVLLRAEMVGETLYVEGRSQVLLPVQAGFKDVYWVSPNPDQGPMAVARAALPRTTGLWLESPIRLMRYWLGGRSDKRTIKLEGQRIERGQPVNYGSSSSLREDAGLPSDPGFYGAMDAVAYSRVITQQIFESLSDMLASCNITSPDLEEQRRLLVEQTFNLEGVRNAKAHGTENRALH
jgi:hypothetical protein